MLKYSAKAFIKVYRKFMEWEWYTDINVKTLFLHCLLRANWKAGVWQGIHFEAGEFITTLPSISEETGLTVRQARTALEKLKLTGELSVKLTDNVTGKSLNKCRIITVNNWDRYQGDDRQADRQIDRQRVRQATGKTAGKRQQKKNIKNIKEYKEYIGADAPVFCPPTLDQVRAYCLERRNAVDPEAFFDYYTRSGWRLTKGGEMKDWKATIRSWERNTKHKTDGFNNAPARDRDMRDLERKLLATN